MDRALSGGGDRQVWVGRATFTAEAAAVAALGYLLARLAVAAYPPLVPTPLGASLAAEAPGAQGWSTLDPFRSAIAPASAPEVVDTPTTSLNLILVGARADGNGRGSALIQTPDNQQRLYRVGDAILADAILSAIEPGRVTILRQDGSSERLEFAVRTSLIGSGVPAEEAAAAEAGVAAPGGPVNGQALMSDITPFESAAGGIGVMPGADGTAFAAAGFQPFDLVLSVNGVGLDNPETWQTAFAGLGSGSTVVVELQRAGAPVSIQFVLE